MTTLATLVLAGWAAAMAVTTARPRRRLRSSPAGAVAPPPAGSPASTGVERVVATLGLRRAAVALAGVLDRARAGPAPDRLAAALPDAVDAVASAIRSGRSVHDGLVVAADAAPPRLAAELRTVTTRAERGMTVVAALDRWAATTDVPGAPLVAAAVGLAGKTGGDVAAALGGVAETLRERRALAREIRALSSQARLSATVIAVAPVAFAGLATAADGDTARFLFGSIGGGLCVLVGVGLDVLGWRWMGRIARSVGDG